MTKVDCSVVVKEAGYSSGPLVVEEATDVAGERGMNLNLLASWTSIFTPSSAFFAMTLMPGPGSLSDSGCCKSVDRHHTVVMFRDRLGFEGSRPFEKGAGRA